MYPTFTFNIFIKSSGKKNYSKIKPQKTNGIVSTFPFRV